MSLFRISLAWASYCLLALATLPSLVSAKQVFNYPSTGHDGFGSLGSVAPNTGSEFSVSSPSFPDTKVPGFADHSSMSPDSWSAPSTDAIIAPQETVGTPQAAVQLSPPENAGPRNVVAQQASTQFQNPVGQYSQTPHASIAPANQSADNGWVNTRTPVSILNTDTDETSQAGPSPSSSAEPNSDQVFQARPEMLKFDSQDALSNTEATVPPATFDTPDIPELKSASPFKLAKMRLPFPPQQTGFASDARRPTGLTYQDILSAQTNPYENASFGAQPSPQFSGLPANSIPNGPGYPLSHESSGNVTPGSYQAIQQQTQLQALPPQPTAPQPTTPRPAIRYPLTQQPVKQGPVKKEPVIQQPVIHQPVTQQPTIQYPLTHQPVIQESVTHQPLNHQPLNHQLLNHQPLNQHTVIQQPAIQYPQTQQPVIQPQPLLQSGPNFRPDLGHRSPTPTTRHLGSLDTGEKFDFEDKKKEYPPLSEILKTGRYFGSAGVRFVRPHFQNNTGITTSSASFVEGITLDHDFETSPHYRFGFESKFGPGIELDYFRFNETSNQSQFTSTGTVTGQVAQTPGRGLSPFGAFNAGETLSATHTINFETFGVSFFKEVQLPISRINGRFGLQYASIAQNLDATLTDATGEIGTFNSRSDFRGFGPKFTLEYYRPIGHTKLEFVTTVSGGVAIGRRDEFVDNSLGQGFSRAGADEILTSIEFFSGAQFKKEIAENRSVFARIGTTYSTWLGGGTANDPQSDFGLRGFSFDVGYNR